MAYKCSRCGTHLGATTYCTKCNGRGLGGWGDAMLDLNEKNYQSAKSANLGIWGDGGCLHCTTKRRRIFFLMITLGCLIAAGILFVLDQ
jgi:hypothetical protein